MDTMIGKTILVGLTWRDHQGKLKRQVQIHGVITKIIADTKTLEIDTPDGECWPLPYYTETIFEPPRGIYICSKSGEEVRNPDLLMSWQIIADEADEKERWVPNLLPFSEPVNPPEWDFTYHPDLEYNRQLCEKKGDSYVGKDILIGLRYYQVVDGDRKFVRQEQLHGEIVRINANEGIVVQLGNGDEYKLPPDLSFLQAAPSGEYTLQATGKMIKDPDFIVTWAIDLPEENLL